LQTQRDGNALQTALWINPEGMEAQQVRCEIPATVTLWNVFERAAARFPDKTALLLADPVVPRSWTYRELLAASRSAAGVFASRGVGAGDIVAVIADRQLETVASYLAALLLGAAYLPIDPRFPIDRFASCCATRRHAWC
jgi:non-ribosomal peptide synthetase component F